jgi:hypothetical protein
MQNEHQHLSRTVYIEILFRLLFSINFISLYTSPLCLLRRYPAAFCEYNRTEINKSIRNLEDYLGEMPGIFDVFGLERFSDYSSFSV